MEHRATPELDPVVLEKSRQIIERLGFAEYADAILQHGDNSMTFTQGLARHWDEVSQLDGAEIYERIAQYKAMYNAQQAELGNR